MPRKIVCFIFFIFCSALLSGCNDVADLTSEETELIAEYAADVLLKYDVNYTNRIDEGEKEIEESASTQDLDISEEGTTTQKPDTTEKDVKEQANAESFEDNDKESKLSAGTEKDIAKVAGISGVSITYKDYLITSRYPEKEDDLVFLEAPNGHQLLVIRFDVANTTKESVAVSLMEKEIDYSIICNGTKAAKPMLTILLNDLGTLETTVDPDKKQEAVLVFQIADDIKNNLDSAQLKITYNNTENTIKMLK